jgi:Fe2+ transport system protein FeoA
MGIFPGALVRVEMVGSRGPVILSIGKTRVGVGRGAAEKIIVEPIELTR